MRLLSIPAVVIAALWGGPAEGQIPDSVPPDSTPVDSATIQLPPPASAPSPPPPTPEQERYLDGLQTAGRGVAQLRTAVGRVARVRAGADTVAQRRAAQTLGGLCGTALDFMSRGRAQMSPVAYEDTTRIKARRLAAQIDALIKFMPMCQANARSNPGWTTTDLEARLGAYEAALKEFRTAIGLPNR